MNQIPNFLLERVRLTPNRIAIATDGEEITFKDLHDRVLNLAYKFHHFGINDGSHVSVLMNNSVQFIEVVYALHYIGATSILLNIRLSDDEIGYQLENSDSEFLIVVKSNTVKIPENIKLLNINEIENSEAKEFPIKSNFDGDKIATMMYTSGTTGFPKAVLQTYFNHWSSAIASVLNLGLDHKDVWLVCLPMFHVGGLSTVYKSAIYGMKIVLTNKADAHTIKDCVIKHNVTILSVVTKVLNDLLTIVEDTNDLNRIRVALLGGGPAPLPLLQKARALNVPVYQTYGMTETCSQIATLSPEYMLSKIGSAGKALFGCTLEIRDDQRTCLPKEVGEIVVKGPNVSKGYYKLTKLTDSSEYLYTGDLGYVDEDGFLFVVDRRSDLIISGGENIYPAEIESVLLSHPDIIEAGVTGKEDPNWGKVPVGFVVSKSSNPLSQEELIEYCRDKIAGYKIPKEIFFVDNLPRNATNKLVRRELLKLL
ncbi:o-succinylbenzoate--CoA ligase [Gottfriedia acidiceleris]|uniref:2-succinylbenzoate--CoA ligase n=1 Tax=Gottfriedia acidiceleris TaxID=371036 RepID=A0ABY4JM73_9BACI|nr:o-succinylbenzoate--CoA ligase [Gottfriedia acidiceleris]UPM54942.1 o-succinylbenzoate--CoA ligase [Gottfriedia acidiceleris]